MPQKNFSKLLIAAGISITALIFWQSTPDVFVLFSSCPRLQFDNPPAEHDSTVNSGSRSTVKIVPRTAAVLLSLANRDVR